MPWLELDAQARRLFSLLILQALMVTDSRDSWSVCKDSLAHIDNGNGHAYAEKEEYEPHILFHRKTRGHTFGRQYTANDKTSKSFIRLQRNWNVRVRFGGPENAATHPT